MWAQFHFGTLEQQLWEITWDIACSKKVRFQGWLKLAEFLLIEFLGFPSLASIISDNFQSILKILLPILLQISWIFWKPLHFLSLHGFVGSYGYVMKKIRNQKKCQFKPNLKSNLFWACDISSYFSWLLLKSTKMKLRPHLSIKK